jgi:hypothetical protein
MRFLIFRGATLEVGARGARSSHRNRAKEGKDLMRDLWFLDGGMKMR